MKKAMIALISMLTIAASGKAMSYEQARNEALFLTDKMAYELNLSDEQYEAAYEINLDYLMGVTSYDDVYGDYWERRNRDLSYVLLDTQWSAFIAASYFYRPLYWSDGYWHFGVYARYPHRDYFYFGRPVFYATYRGGHAWHVIGGNGYYHGRRSHFQPVGRPHHGMADRFHRGHHYGVSHSGRPSSHHSGHFGYRSGNRVENRPQTTHHQGNFGGPRSSSTRTTVHQQSSFGGSRNSGSFSGSRNSGSFSGSRSNGSFSGSRSNGSFSGSRSNGGSSSGSGSFGGSRNSGSHSSGSHSSGGRFGR